jgi:predicted DNA-binding protein (MmcQ/YjbR family)
VNLETLRRICLSFADATEDIQWEHQLLFRVGRKMFAIAALDLRSPYRFAFKTKPERFAALVEQEGIVPAPYLARHHWVALDDFDVLPSRELEQLVQEAYALVRAGLPAKTRASLERARRPSMSRPGLETVKGAQLRGAALRSRRRKSSE